MSKKSTPKGLIILVHDVMGPIPEEEIIEVLPDEWTRLPRPTVHIAPEKIQHGEAMNYHWRSMLIEQERIYKTEIKPLFDKHPDYQVLYFGLAPIPLAVHLGNLVTSFRNVKAYLKRQTEEEGDEKKPAWEWPKNKDAGDPLVTGLPKDKFNGEGHVVIRFGTRFEINAANTEEVVSHPTKEIEIYPPKTSNDLFGSFGQMAHYAGTFSNVMDAISSNLPEVRDIHLFAAIPVGLSFLIGQKINPNAHALVHVYHYTGDASKPYYLAYTANEELNAELLEVTKEEQKAYQQKRAHLLNELKEFRDDELVPMLENEQTQWFKAIAPDLNEAGNLFTHDYWKNLSKLDPNRLKVSFLESESAESSEDEGYYYFTDRFMKVISSSQASNDAQFLVAQLFAIRETVYELSHGIRSESMTSLVMYPRVTEEADYQADVYSLLHVFFCSRKPYDQAADFFCEMIEAMINTWWAFDCARGRTKRMEVQRVNRYLTWYYLLCQLESGTYGTLQQVLELIARKPILELRLHALKPGVREKVEFDLEAYEDQELGIVLFHNGQIKAHHFSIGTTPISGLMEGLRDLEPDRVKQVLNALINETLA